jgi:short-subunit dehydrogenase
VTRQREGLLAFLIGVAAGSAALSILIREAVLRANPHYFEDKVVLITGASRGIGRALAHAFAARGAHIILAARSADSLDAVAAECRTLDPAIKTLVVPTDVTDSAQLEALVAAAIDAFGRVDILVSNAGIMQGGRFVDLDEEATRRHLEIHLMATMTLTRLLIGPMLARRSGHIVLMSSAAGRHSMPYFLPYDIAKHALTGFGEGLRKELIGTGVQVLTVSPGYTRTNLVDRMEGTFKRMGFALLPAELVARRTLEALILSRREVNIGALETLGQWASAIFPFGSDWYWRLFMPADFPERAAKSQADKKETR